jgi:transcriptional regulator with XRE-family HTH domain
MKEFRPAKKRITVSVGESVRIVRELQGLSQNQLAERTGIPQATLSAIENDRVRLGVERAKVLARAQVPPGRTGVPRMGSSTDCGMTAAAADALKRVAERDFEDFESRW